MRFQAGKLFKAVNPTSLKSVLKSCRIQSRKNESASTTNNSASFPPRSALDTVSLDVKDIPSEPMGMLARAACWLSIFVEIWPQEVDKYPRTNMDKAVWHSAAWLFAKRVKHVKLEARGL